MALSMWLTSRTLVAGTWLKAWAGEVRNVSLLVASAVDSEGFREILGICEGAKEDKSGWSAFRAT